MSLETSVAKLCYAAGVAANGAMSRRAKSCVNGRSWAGAIVMAIPMFGLDVLIYSIILWGMYSRLSSIAGVPFWKNFFSNVFGGFIVNLVIMFGLNFVLDFVVVFGWIGMGIAGYMATYFSGVAYIEVLTQIHGRNKVKDKLDYTNAGKAFWENGGKSALTGMATGALVDTVSDTDNNQE